MKTVEVVILLSEEDAPREDGSYPMGVRVTTNYIVAGQKVACDDAGVLFKALDAARVGIIQQTRLDPPGVISPPNGIIRP